MLQIAIERAVLASYLLIDLTENIEEHRKQLDATSFIIPLHKRIVANINIALKEEKPLSLLCLELTKKMKDLRGNYTNEYLDILATMPLTNKTGLDWYIKKLIEIKAKREIDE